MLQLNKCILGILIFSYPPVYQRGEEIKTKPLFVWAGGGSAARGFCQPNNRRSAAGISHQPVFFWDERGVLALDFVDHHPSLFERDECCGWPQEETSPQDSHCRPAARNYCRCRKHQQLPFVYAYLFSSKCVRADQNTRGKILLYEPCQ